MRLLVYTLSIGSLVGTYYQIADGITYSDIFCALLFLITIWNVGLRKWHTDKIFRLMAGYIPIMLVSAIINNTLLNTVFINFFRIYFEGCLVYFCLSNVFKSQKDIRSFLFLMSIYVVAFLINFRDLLASSFIVSNFTEIDFGYGRNNVGFTALLLTILVEFCYFTRLMSKYVLILIPVFIVVVLFSASRFSTIMLIGSFLLFRILSGKKFSFKEICLYVVVILVFPVIMNYVMQFGDKDIFQFTQDMLASKMDNVGEDAFDVRVISINVKPIEAACQNFYLHNYIFGDGISVQHSFFSHAFITTGIIGLLYYLIYNAKLLRWSFRFKGVDIFLFILLLVMLANDFITNAHFMIPVNSILFGTICAVMYKNIQLR